LPETIPSGTRLGPYEIEGLLGAGGMGEVYRAKDGRLAREVALKVLPASFAADPERLRRFEREARSAGQLNHPNIVAIYDVGVAGNAPYLVSELIEGATLRERLSPGPLPPRKAIALAIQIANGLAAAHAKGIVHRDLKPENLMVLKGDRLKIVDFGLAKLVRDEAPLGEDTATLSPQLTETGAILGTASYMAPEQIRQQPVDHRADLFALGAILHEMLSGRRAFDGPTPMDRLSAILNSTPRELPRAVDDAAPGLSSLVERCLEKNVDDRFQNAHDLAFALGLIDFGAARTGASPAAVSVAAAAGATKAVRELTFKRMTYRQGSIQSARFAPDGTAICFCAAWENRPAELFWAYPGNPESRPLGFPGTDILAIAPSGEMLVSMRRRARGGFTYTGTLARMPAGGGATREIMEEIREADWSPDGRQMLVVRDEGGFERIEYPIGTALHATPGWISHVRLSPDGTRIAFLDHPLRGNDAGGPAVMDLKGKVTHLSKDWSSTRGLAWSPDGGEILFTAFRTGVGRELYATSPDGTQRLLLQVPGHMTLADVSRQGAVLFSLENERMRTEYLPVDDSAARDLTWLDWSMVRSISGDGRTLLLEESGVGGGELHAVYLRGTDGSPAIRLGDGTAFDLSSDGRWALSGVGSPRVLWQLPCGAGQARALPTPGVDVNSARWLPDGSICVVAYEPGHGMRLHRLDPATGALAAFGEEGLSWHEIMVSPDGRSVAAMGPDRVMKIYYQDGSDPRLVPQVTLSDRPLAWSADSGALFVFGRGEIPAKVFRVDLATGEREVWKQLTPMNTAGVEGLTGVRMTPDGEYAYSYMQRLSILYVVEGLLDPS
jgi:hypothetical protein